MISRLRGSVVEVTASGVVLEVSGVGYEVFLPSRFLASVEAEPGEVILETRQIFREDGVTLYGFLNGYQRRLFDLLLEVKGCGPKLAHAVLATLGEDGIVSALAAEDSRALAQTPGVGARLADRILLEIREKVLEESRLQNRPVASKAVIAASQDSELVAALINLGYRRSDAEAAAGQTEGGTIEARLRSALKILSAGRSA